MTNRFLGIAIFWLLLLATAFVAEPYMVTWWYSASSPRTIAPRTDLTETERTTIKLFQTVSPSIVSVFARTNPRNLLKPGQEESDVQTGSAGHVITNYHVIKGTDEFAAHLASGESVPVRVIGTAPNYDIAVLQLERTQTPPRPIAIGNSADLQVGQSAFATAIPMAWSRP